MKLSSAIIFIAATLPVNCHPPKIECYVGDELDRQLEHGFSYCKYHHKGPHSFVLTGHNGRSARRDEFFQESPSVKTHKCDIKLDKQDEFDLKCVCTTSGCNDPGIFAERMGKEFSAILNPQQ